MTIMQLSKFEAAERQLHTAITLFFKGSDPVSIHTLSEAAAQVLYDIGEQYGAKSLTRDSDLIRPERRKEWLQALVKSRNFFKHADRDANEIHDFNIETNNFSIFDALGLFLRIKKIRTPETLLFEVWFALKYPNLLVDSQYKDGIQRMASNVPELRSGDLTYFSSTLVELREGRLKLPNVTLTSGLQNN